MKAIELLKDVIEYEDGLSSCVKTYGLNVDCEKDCSPCWDNAIKQLEDYE